MIRTVLTKNVFAFLGAASKRPEIAAVIPSYQPAVPQLYADVDKAKALQQQVQLSDVYATMSDLYGRLPGELLQPLRTAVADLC